jgi:adenosylmethionine-8-amino-7-oxononanoate aminotransferase
MPQRAPREPRPALTRLRLLHAAAAAAAATAPTRSAQRFFDGIGGIFTVSLGHGHPAVVDAVKRQVDQMTFAPPMHGIADVTFDFIERLSSVTPPGMDYVKTYSGASEAMESAIKFSRQYWKQSGHPGKYKFISRYQSYHGCAGGTQSKLREPRPAAPSLTELIACSLDWRYTA